MNSSNPDIKVKKRYNKFMAFLLANGVVATVLYIVMLAGGIANGSEIDAASFGVIFITLSWKLNRFYFCFYLTSSLIYIFHSKFSIFICS